MEPDWRQKLKQKKMGMSKDSRFQSTFKTEFPRTSGQLDVVDGDQVKLQSGNPTGQIQISYF